MDLPNGEPGSNPAGASAVTRSPQQAQRPPNRRTSVTSGLAWGSSMRSYTCCGVWVASGKAAWQRGQAGSLASTTRSGSGCNRRPTPGRPWRGGRSAGAARFSFWPCEGGLDELSGVFGGRLNSSSRASSAAMRASCAAIVCCADASCANSARISASFSAGLSLLRSGRGVTPRLESIRP